MIPGICVKYMGNKPIAPNKCPGCGEELRQVEFEYMKKEKLERCVKCRAKQEMANKIKK